MKKILIVSALLPSLCLQTLSAQTQDAKRAKPNIITILVDDMGYADIGANGSTYYETPNIDALAANGIRFTNAYAAAAICSPTRAALMTGKYPARIGITDWILADFQGGKVVNDQNPVDYVSTKSKPLSCPPNPLFMELKEVTIAERLKQNGYTTCHLGKWHLGPEKWYPTQQGFDYNIGGSDLGQPPSYFDPYENYNKDSVKYNIATLAPRKQGEYLTDRLGDELINFITQHKDKPFFVNCASYAVHTPLEGKKELVEKYKQKKAGEQNNPVYAAMIESLDQNVGKLVKALDSLHLLENTIIIFTSDNGGLLPVTNNLGLRSGKGYPYEGGIKIPLIVYWKQHLQKPAVIDQPVITMDIAATIIHLSGGDQKLEDGNSILPILLEPKTKRAEDLFWHFPHYRGKDVTPYSIVRSGDFKLIRYYDDTPFELYDLKHDPLEQHNIYTTNRVQASTLEQKLEAWLSDVHAKLPIRNNKAANAATF